MKKKTEMDTTKYIASCSFGKDSIATILLALEHNEPLDRVVFVEVMFDHERCISGEIPEHIEWIYGTAIPKLESMGIKVDVVHSDKDYMYFFHKKRTERSNTEYIGKLLGFPRGGRCWANSGLKIEPIRKYYKQIKGPIVQYVGIAKDEPKRLARLKDNQISLLAKYGYNESDAMEKCKEYNLVSPIYSTTHRGGVGSVRIEVLRFLRRLREIILTFGWNLISFLAQVDFVPTVLNTARPLRKLIDVVI